MSYKYDIFISYKRDEWVLEWIKEEFLPRLRKSINSYYPEEGVRIFLDEELRGGDVPKPHVIDAIKNSKIIIPILAPPYFVSHWCSAEWKTFQRREQVTDPSDNTDSLRIPIRLVDCEDYARHMGEDSPIPLEFNAYHHTGEAWRRSHDYHSFCEEMRKLSENIRQRLDRVGKHSDEWPFVSCEEAGPLCSDMCSSLHNGPHKL